MTSPLLQDMTGEELQALAVDLRKQKAEMIAERAEIRRLWMIERVATPMQDRVELTADLSAVCAELAAVELELINGQKARKAAARERAERERETWLLNWHWSDQMLAALQHICDVNGTKHYIKQAKQMVAEGWPNAGKYRLTEPKQNP